ncbi:12812_t:CDS:2 [Funneliformis geosporum]|uniref:12812_t:CDS:1 n=1 Tax=Funneliformis geosporum TaxID=1117311 RepID=A0A9W4SFK7_9GLOM|nr:12812_t:CDS:2 [Funneliformis geosporum]
MTPWPCFIITKIAYPGSHKDNPPSHYYENNTSGSKNKNTAEIVQGHSIDLADNAGGLPTGRDQAIGYLRGCMKGRTLEWFNDEITTKQNWELTNLTDSTGQANLVAVNGHNADQIDADGLNEILGQPEN